MRTLWTMALALGLCCLIGTGDLLAQQAGQGRQKKQRGGQQGKVDEQQLKADVQQFLNRFDRDEDEAIEKNELPRRLQQDFKDVDENNDGKLDRKELRDHALRMNAMCDQGQTGYILIYRAVEDPVSLNDLQDAYQTLRMIDEDHNGKITQQEIRDAQQKVRKRHADSVFHEWDRNNDGKLSKDEVGRFMGERFDRLDRNGDNSIDQREMEDAFVAQQTERTSASGAGTLDNTGKRRPNR